MSFVIKRSDTQPTLRATLLKADGTAQSLTGATVRFVMVTAAGSEVINRPAEVNDAEAGVVWFVFTALETATAGVYRAEFRVTYAGGAVETFPNNGHLNISINPGLA